MKTFLPFILFGLGMTLVKFTGKACLVFLADILPPDTLPSVLGLIISLAITILAAVSVSTSGPKPKMPIHHNRQSMSNIVPITLMFLIFPLVWLQADRHSSLGKLVKVQTEQIRVQEQQIQEMNMMISSAQSACSR